VGILCVALNVYFYILLARIILSWVTMFWSPPSSVSPLIRAIYDVTEPVLGPLRRILPPMGGFDFSPILVFIILRLVAAQICAAGI
jgi:YggT family protein